MTDSGRLHRSYERNQLFDGAKPSEELGRCRRQLVGMLMARLEQSLRTQPVVDQTPKIVVHSRDHPFARGTLRSLL